MTSMKYHPRWKTLHGGNGICNVDGYPAAPPPAGRRFNTRCPLATDQCRTEMPALLEVAPGHEVRCHRWTESRTLLTHTEQPTK
jgi:peptide/nickel transport system ATP-binding protein